MEDLCWGCSRDTQLSNDGNNNKYNAYCKEINPLANKLQCSLNTDNKINK